MDRETTSEGRLFLAALPDTVTADRIFDLSSVLKRAHRLSGKPILPKQLHVSLFFLGGLPDEMLRRVCKRVADVRAAPFEVSFDRTVSFRGRTGSRPFVLTGGDGPNPLKSFRQTLGVALASTGLRRRANVNFTPHVTLLYDARSVEEYPIRPIAWTVREFVLVYSMHGHTHLARWALHC